MQPRHLCSKVNIRFTNDNRVDRIVINNVLFSCDLVTFEISQQVLDPEPKEPVLDLECFPVQVVHTVLVAAPQLLLLLEHSEIIVICARSFEPLKHCVL